MSSAGSVDWTLFAVLVIGALAIDFALAASGRRPPGLRSAALWSAAWIALALGFGAWIAFRMGAEAGLSYVTAYVLEKSLSVDNLFVFLVIFAQTGIPPALQHRALFWGVAGALLMRALLIGAGAWLLAQFHWLIYAFAALLAYAAIRMLQSDDRREQFAEASCALCSSWIGRLMPITPVLHGSRFLVRKDGALMATPLLVALVVIETSDLVFAIDSIPAVFSVTRDPFLVYTSNIFALLGLRSLYFLLAGVIARLRFLRIGLALMLLFAALKMVLGGHIDIPPLASLGVIAGILALSVIASRLFPGTSMPACSHLGDLPEVQPASRGCAECLKRGDTWVHLRMCLSCGNVGCCDSSKNKHATAHFHASGHPVMRSMQPGERWKWCYIDRVTLP